MKPFSIRTSFLAGLAVLAALSVPPSVAMTPEEAACRATIAKSVAKQVRLAGKAIAGCHRRRDAGTLPAATDCNDLSIAAPGETLLAAQQSLRDRLVSAHGPCAAAPGVLAACASCKSPAETADDAGATTGIDDFSELAECRIATVRALVESTARQVLGSPDVAHLTPDAIDCHRALATLSVKAVNTIVRERSRCQAALDAAGGPIGYGCEGEDPTGRIAWTMQRLYDRIAQRCGALGLEDAYRMDSCGDTAAQLEDCVAAQVTSRIGSGLASSSFASGVCPRGLELILDGGYASMRTGTEANWGVMGCAHNQDLGDRAVLVLALDCDAETCGTCNIALDSRANLPEGNCRCSGDASVACSTINADDPACGGGHCDCFLFPPQPMAAFGTPLCLVQSIEAPLSGTVDPAKGSAAIGVETKATFHLGDSVVSGPCPHCDGDLVAQDGVRDGNCSGGERAGLPCDTNAVHGTWGPLAYDCPPSAGMALGIAAVDLAPLTDDSVIAAPSTCRNGDSCSADCVADTEDDDYHCDDAGPIDKFCDGLLTASGRGVVPCEAGGDWDCRLFAAGTCTVTERRSCFPDSSILEGSGAAGRSLGPFRARMVAAPSVCFEPPPSGLSAGLLSPVSGTARLRYDFALDPKCGVCQASPATCCEKDSDCGTSGPCVPGGRSWAPPTGSSCGC